MMSRMEMVSRNGGFLIKLYNSLPANDNCLDIPILSLKGTLIILINTVQIIITIKPLNCAGWALGDLYYRVE